MTIIDHLATEPRERINDAVRWLEQGDQIAMLTLINIEGNAPYPIGSQMLVSSRGNYLGQITGGCAEVALAEQAKIAIAISHNTVERYGLDSPYFDIQLPCGSGVDVYFDVTTPLQAYRDIQESLTRRAAVECSIEYGDQRIAKEYLPNERLLIVGKGPIVQALIESARHTGFDVVYFIDESAEVINEYCDQYTVLVSLFHEHELEIDILAMAVKTNLFYIGALGSKRTHQARLENLAEKGCERRNLDKIHGPVGANIGAVSPGQIAISILSEIVDVMNRQ